MASDRSKKLKPGTSNGVTQLQLPLLSEALKECELLRLEISQLRQENAKLLADNARMKSGPGKSQVSETRSIYPAGQSPNAPTPNAPDSRSSYAKLFFRLFCGREDVYAQRWQRDDGSGGYSPAKSHDWNNHTKNASGKSKCAPTCKLLPFTEKVVQDHLDGRIVAGIYPMQVGDTCCLLAVDFDKAEWSDDALAFLEACDAQGVPAYLERSRSGAGGHVWIFFESPVRASKARELGSFLISEAKQRRYQLGFESYDRMFPNQDTMPKGGYGNLIALPLQLSASRAGNSVFVDRDLRPFPDQWAFLSSIERMRASALDSIVRVAAAQDAIITVPLSSDDLDSEEPWKARRHNENQDKKLKPPHPAQIEVVLSNMIYLSKSGFAPAALSKIMAIAAFQNPEFYQKQALRQSTHDTPRVICCADNFDKYIALPRGSWDSLKECLDESGIEIKVRDERFKGSAIGATFRGELKDVQKVAVSQILRREIGVISASTAFGKTVVASYVLGERKTNTLILVHTLALVDQWKERLAQFLDLPPGSIGQLGGGKKKRTGIVDVATIQSLIRNGEVSAIVSEYGQIIVDECHHISAFSFEQVIKQAKAKYVLGLTATPVRKDGHQPIIMMHCGPIVFKDSFKNRKKSGVKHVVIRRETGFQMPATLQVGAQFHELYDALATSQQRNDLIFDDILKELDRGRSPLVITERIEHLDGLAARLEGFAKNVLVFKGGMTKKERTAAFSRLKDIPKDAERIILATGKFIGEGFDDARLDTLFLLLPISFEGRVEQYAGRLHREHDGKTDVRIYDYVDASHPVLKKMFERRCVKYRKLGYDVENLGGAV